MKFSPNTLKLDQMGGCPVYVVVRIPVAAVIGMVAEGMSHEEIMRSYPDLEKEDLQEAVSHTFPKRH